ncbi:hypothetical protein, conserved [Leishmania tarentolae]|uniref:Uncharacterized protein n=1 Tax=Leishmania tarentolae TaxID=5689 RepID=A0A640KSE5_LEITA|nr:hypothetical protein, conserved [Leishmania tarentolae]
MTTLKDGRFLFIHADRHNLLLEQSAKVASVSPSSTTTVTATATSLPASSPTFQLVYGGVVHAFALNAAQSHIAMICPSGSAAATSAAAGHLRGDGPSTVLRLFSFSSGEVGALIDELVTTEACGVVWVGNRHLALDVRLFTERVHREAAASSPSSMPSDPVTSTILIEVTKTPEKLKYMRQDHATASPVSVLGSFLCEIRVAKQSLRFWDLRKEKVTHECVLPNRRHRQGKTRVAAAACSDGPFVFVVNDDWTVHGFYVRNNSVRELKPMLSQFESQLLNVANSYLRNAKVKEMNNEGQGVAEGGEGGEPLMQAQPIKSSALAHKLARPRLFACAISDKQVLLALQGSSTVLQCACQSKGSHDDEWVVVAKMHLTRRLHAMCEVVGLSPRGCLVRQYELTDSSGPTSTADVQSHAWMRAPANGQKTVAYFVVPLEMKATGKASVGKVVPLPPVIAACGSSDTTEGSAVAPRANTAGGKNGETAVTSAVASEASRTEGKRKRKKKSSAPADAAVNGDASAHPSASATSPAATSTSVSGTGNAQGGGRDHGSAGSPLQGAVRRLLVHAGIAGKDQFHDAFAKDDARYVVDVAAADVPAAPERGREWYSTDMLMSAGGVVVGVVLGVVLMRRLGLL